MKGLEKQLIKNLMRYVKYSNRYERLDTMQVSYKRIEGMTDLINDILEDNGITDHRYYSTYDDNTHKIAIRAYAK